MRGRVEVQSRARRSYRAVVIPTDALLTLGILKFTSLMVVVDGDGQRSRGCFGGGYWRDYSGSQSVEMVWQPE